MGKLGNFYNIGSNKNLINLEICKKLIQIGKTKMKLGKNVKIDFVKDRPGHDVRYALNSNKLIRDLKWKPKTNLTAGLIKTFTWYLENLQYFKLLNKKDVLNRLGLKK